MQTLRSLQAISLQQKWVKRCSGNFISIHHLVHLILKYPFSFSCPGHPYPSPENNQTLQGMLILKSVKDTLSKDQYWPLGWLVLPSGWVGLHQQSGLHPRPLESLLVWLLWLLGQLTRPEFTIWASAYSAWTNLTVVSGLKVIIKSFWMREWGLRDIADSVEYFFSILPGFQQWLQSGPPEFPYPAPDAKDYEKGFCRGINLAWSTSPVG